jgi:hypothetical protein
MNHAVRPGLLAVAEQDQSFRSPGQAGMGPSVDAEPVVRPVAGGGPWTAALQGTGWAWAK